MFPSARDGRFLDARGDNVLITNSTSNATTKLYLSTDKGETFNDVVVPLGRNTLCRISTDAQHLYMYSSISQRFYKSSDGGTNWVQHHTHGGGTWFQISDDGRYYLFCHNNANAIVSGDYGETWTNFIGMKANRGDVSSSGQYMCTVGKDGGDCYVNVSNDYGVSWTEQILNIGGSTTNDCEVSINKTGKYMLLMSSQSNLRVSSDYGVSFQEIPNTNQQWKHCEISYLNPQYMYAQLQNQTNTIWESQDYGQSWSAVYNHPQNIIYESFVSTNEYLFAFNRGRNRIDRYTFTHTAPSGSIGEETSGGGLSEQSSAVVSVLYNTAEMTRRHSRTIENENTVSFDINVESDFKLYDIVLLADGPTKPLYHGSLFNSSSESFIVDVCKLHISSVSLSNNILSFHFDSNHTGNFILGVTKKM